MTNTSKFASPGGGPGYRRMLARLGPAGYDALCEDSLLRKTEALAEARAARVTWVAPEQRDRAWYDDYPLPMLVKGRARRKR